jgi:hypothetical protein
VIALATSNDLTKFPRESKIDTVEINDWDSTVICVDAGFG